MRLLVVEDQRQLGEFLKAGLTEQSFSVTWARSCAEARTALCEDTFGAIVLDLGLPDGDGLDVLREWRSNGFIEPVLILSARDSVHDRIKGLDVGADDYLAKPFSFEELLARLRALLRRQSAIKTALLQHHDITLDTVSRTVRVKDTVLELTAREFSVLEVFMQNPGRIVTRSMICETIWSSNFENDANLLDVYMSRLRARLEGPLGRPAFKTLRGVGYQLL